VTGAAPVDSGVVRTDHGGVVELRLDRPEARNALNTTVLTQLRRQLEQIQDSPEVRAVILSGSGTVFCAGADTREFSPRDSANAGIARVRLVAEVIRRLSELEHPTIAVVQGGAIGAGWGLSLACDLCFAVEGAMFSLPEVSKGYRLPHAIPARLARIVGPIKAADIVLTGARRSCADGVADGWVNQSFPDHAAALSHARYLAQELARSTRASMTAAKAAIRAVETSAAVSPSPFDWQKE
jgi:enoyl-CoA hydratase/carnithine racemase